MAERAKAVGELFENRQSATADALADLLKEVELNEQRKREQAEKGFDGLIPIRNTDPPDLLALFPHYFSEEVVP